MADRYDKAIIAQRLKLCEIGVSVIAIAGFWLHSVPILFVALFLFGVIGSLFGPIKYGILPDHLANSELPAGNALVEGATFMAILLGTIVGGLAAKAAAIRAHFAGADDGVRAAVLGIEPVHPEDRRGRARPRGPTNIAISTARLLRHLREDRRLWWGALVTSWFWLVGAVVLSLLPPLVKNVLGGDEEVVTIYLAVFSIAIAIGSGLAAWLAAGRIVLLPTLVGAVVLGVFAIDLGWVTYGVPQIARAVGRTSRSSPRPADSAWRSISPGSRSRAASTSCRPLPRCRPGPAPTGAPASSPPSTCSTPPSWSAAPWSWPCCRRGTLDPDRCSC